MFSGNVKKSTWILQRAFELDAKPTELLQNAVQNLKSGRGQLLSHEDKENVACKPKDFALYPYMFNSLIDEYLPAG